MNTKTVLPSLPIVMLATCLLLGCGQGVRGSGVANTETRELSAFEHVTFSGAGHVDFSIGTPQRFEITADDNLLPLIETRVVDGRLVIRPKEAIRPRNEVTVRIRVPRLQGVALEGGATAVVPDVTANNFGVAIAGGGTMTVMGKTERLSVKIKGDGRVDARRLKARNADVRITGSGHVRLETMEKFVGREQYDIEITGSGTASVAGQVEHLNVRITGSGTVEATDLGANKARVQIMGAGDVALHAAEELDVTIDGSGNVRYRGDPKVTKDISKGASLVKIK
jgi:hypothetical protein